MMQLAKKYQAQDIENHTANGGKIYSNWRAVGIGLLIGLIVAAVIIAVVMIIS